MTLVVADAGPLIALHGIDRLALLRPLYGSVLTPPEVLREVAPSIPLVPEWIVGAEASTEVGADLRASRLDAGEIAAIHLARERSADWILLDDLAARRWALARGMPVVGAAGILVLA